MISNARFGLGYRLDLQRHPDSISPNGWPQRSVEDFLAQTLAWDIPERAGLSDNIVTFYKDGSIYILDNQGGSKALTPKDYWEVKEKIKPILGINNVDIPTKGIFSELETIIRGIFKNLLDARSDLHVIKAPYQVVSIATPEDPTAWTFMFDADGLANIFKQAETKSEDKQ